MRTYWAFASLFALAFVSVAGVGSAAPSFNAEFIYLQDPGFPNCHCSSIIQLQNGDLLCAWYGYSGSEKGTACEVRYSRKPAGSDTWTAPQSVIWDPLPNGDRTQGNVVLWQDPNGKVWCFYDVRTAVEWATTQLKYTSSTDNGHTWSAPVNMAGELGWNVRCHAFAASNGNWILPAYSDVNDNGAMFISTNQGASWSLSGTLGNPGDPSVIQPSVIERSDHSLRALLRKWGAPLNIHESYSYDYGWTWTYPAPISLPNPQSSVEQAKLANGHVVLIFNNTISGRTPLSAALSTDEGATWTAIRNLETVAGEYSYPSIIQTADGRIHVTYTHQRTHIKHVVFNEEWLAAGDPSAFRTLTSAAQAAIVTDNTSWTVPEQKAAAWLHDEIVARTGMNVPVVDHSAFTPSSGVTAFLVGRAGHHALIDALRPSLSLPAEGFHLEMMTSVGNPYVICAGADNRGTLYAVGKCLRKMNYASARLIVPSLNEESSPQNTIRGHQLGYRETNNTIDKWDVPQFEQYFRDLLIFGINSVELIPPRSPSNPAQGPLMVRTPWDMNLQLCSLCNEYDLKVWMWLPAEVDLTNPTLRAQLLADRTALFAACSRIDAVFVPGGDPGSNTAANLVSYCQDLATALRSYHPNAEMWISNQKFSFADRDWFYNYLQTVQPTWFNGLVYGPSSPDLLANTRAQVPAQYGVRHYPDITHCVRSQYPVPEWDHAYALTEGREPINPRPVAEAHICTVFDDYIDGAVTYSDGVHDDVNKAIWSARLWDRNASVWETLEDYNRYFFSNEFGEGLVTDILNLEGNWVGSVRTNSGIDTTLANWQAMEAVASAGTLANNWRFQEGLFRACYDAYVRARRIEAASLEQTAYNQLAQARSVGANTAINNALATLASQDGSGVGAALRARIMELGEDLNTTIGMQMSVPLYGASGSERGAVLDFLDEYLNNRIWLENELNAILGLGNETDKLAGITRLIGWEMGGPDGFYEDLGNGAEGKEPHLIHAKTWEEDPGDLLTVADAFDWNKYLSARLSWRQAAATDVVPLEMNFDGLDPAADYTVKTTYGYGANFSLDADGVRIHNGFNMLDPPRQYEYAIPQGLTADGKLTLSWQMAGTSVGVGEVWLERTNPHLIINDGATYATSATLDLDLWARNPREMQFQYPGSGGWTAWEPFSFTKQVTVTAPDGTVQVDFKVRYTDMTVSGTYSDTIILAATPLTAEAGANKTIAPSGSTTLDGAASGGLAPYTYSWSPTTGLNNPNIAQPTASPATTTTYTLTVHDSLLQIATDTVTVTVATDDAAVVSSAVPASTLRNRAAGIQITMQNTGTTTWTAAAGYALSSVNPNDNTTWGLNRVQLSPSDSIAPGQSKTFAFNITVPNSATYLTGPLHCDWQMINGSTRFGAVSSNPVTVYTFYDVPPTETYWKYVEAIYTAGLTAGCGADSQGRALYCPNNTTTRAMAAVYLVRATGKSVLMSPTPRFADVGPGLSYYGHVERLGDPSSWYDAGNPCLVPPTAGCAISPPRYCPDDLVTRAMVADKASCPPPNESGAA